MALDTYRAKRRFGVTSEPRGKKARNSGNAYVIQKHAATRLHYDLRLELDGVMKSWAVTRGPSLVPTEKRLAVHVEDHPIEYNAFEGTIPKGEYGGGTVMIWDRGTWEPKFDPHHGYKKGHLEFFLHGEKLKGHWHLVRMKKRVGERQEPWLLIKGDDEIARTAKDADILEEKDKSALSGRTLDEIAAGKPVKKKSARGIVQADAQWSSKRKGPIKPEPPAKAVRAARSRTAKASVTRKSATRKRKKGGPGASLPDFVPPCLAALGDNAPNSKDWVHEIKFDGYRMQARIERGAATLKTRTGLDWSEKFASVIEALEHLPVEQALIDGEIVVETEHGIPSFSALQEEIKAGGAGFAYYVFDLLHRDGRDLTKLPLIERKDELARLVDGAARKGIVRFSEHFETDGSVLLDHACRLTLEGIVSKRRDSPYRSGRNSDWLKIKCSSRQEFVVVGYAPASNATRAVGALVLGFYDEDGALHYAGRAGTGFTQKSARELWARLDPLAVKQSPFKPLPEEERGREGVWVKPRLVAEVDFRGWTHGLRLRHPSFKGLRDDKPAQEVVREVAAMTKAAKPTRSKAEKNARTGKGGPKPARASQARTDAAATIPLTNPDRVYWPDVGLTKQGLADHYSGVWEWIAPHVVGRALSLVRCPEGISGQCFFQKHASAGLESKHLKLVKEDNDHVISISNLEGLLSLVQAGVLEIHVRGSTTEHLEAADRIVFDLDPAPDVGWPDVAAAARDVRERLKGFKLESYLKTTGGKGLHVVVPIAPAPWDDVKAFTKAFAFAMQADDPKRYIATAAKKARAGRIFVDYLRNSREATAICAYSTRARDGATVSAPIAWDELGRLSAPNQYTVANLGQRLARLKRDPWDGIARAKQRLPSASTGKSKGR